MIVGFGAVFLVGEFSVFLVFFAFALLGVVSLCVWLICVCEVCVGWVDGSVFGVCCTMGLHWDCRVLACGLGFGVGYLLWLRLWSGLGCMLCWLVSGCGGVGT